METVRISKRGQITIPRNIRKALNIQEGDTIALIPAGDQVIMRPMTQTLRELRGSVIVKGEQDFDAIRKRVAKMRTAKRQLDEQ